MRFASSLVAVVLCAGCSSPRAGAALDEVPHEFRDVVAPARYEVSRTLPLEVWLTPEGATETRACRGGRGFAEPQAASPGATVRVGCELEIAPARVRAALFKCHPGEAAEQALTRAPVQVQDVPAPASDAGPWRASFATVVDEAEAAPGSRQTWLVSFLVIDPSGALYRSVFEASVLVSEPAQGR